ncbi:MAG TPA: BadF/BadG/BcrA/BcrD ATPase family protein [Gaiellaceae bacterium]|nr:BadF/BadG/BcrA/BcrD ATPase family protein [Gaiellaceae bacterium]
MRVVLGVDGGNSKTELVAATTAGELLAVARGPGSNSHAVGVDGVARVLSALVAETGAQSPAACGVFYLCGADVPADLEELSQMVAVHGWVREAVVDNDTFALLRAGTGRADAVAVICGAGINCVGRRSDGRVARYPALGWETGDWGGAEMLGREALFLAARAEDGRGEQTAMVDAIRAHFGLASVERVGIEIHYGRLAQARLGELAPLVLAAARDGDPVADALVTRGATEVALWVRRAFGDLEVNAADVVLGGGMFQGEPGPFHERVLERLPAGAHAIVLDAPPVLGAALAALDLAGAEDAAKARLREELLAR